MNANEILDEIHRYREEHARAFGYDIHKIFADIRRNTEQLKAEGWTVVSPAPRQAKPASPLREEPPKPSTDLQRQRTSKKKGA